MTAMISGDETTTPQPGGSNALASRITLDELLRHIAARRPDALALADAPNRESFTDGAPRRLTYGKADRMVSAIAGRLCRMGLPTDTIVGIQLPNTVEYILTILGVLRAGMIAAPLPLLWRRADAVAALARIGAKALITCSRVGNFDHGRFATRIAADVFAIRYVCGFGENLADGLVPMDDLFTIERLDPITLLDREGSAAARLAVINFEISDHGPVAVARRHLELLAGGMGVLLESRFAERAQIVSTIAPSCFAGLALTLVPWLLTGGTLHLHHGFDDAALARQYRNCSAIILPAPIVFPLAEAGLFAPDNAATVLAAWYCPDRLASSALWRQRDGALIDFAIFGEAGFVAGRRGEDGRPLPLPLGPVVFPREGAAATSLAELGVTALNTLAIRGPMVPHHHFPPRIERSDQPHFAIGRDGYVDTGFACRIDPVRQSVVVTGPPAGFVNVGGYRFALRQILEMVARIDVNATLTALPDALLGQRFVGTASDCGAMQVALGAHGVNPLISAAFSEAGARDLRQAAAG
jgi:hypothetical protein